MTKAFVFPGQGSQKKGMGKGLFEKFPELVRQADEQLGYSVEALCLQDPNDDLRRTQYTQPALYVVDALTYLDRIQKGEKPDFVAGHSLGEYDALFAAEAFDFLTGLRLVQERGRLMGQVSGSGMAAVMEIPIERIRALLREEFPSLDVANLNTPAQTVIAGMKDDIETAQETFEKAGARYTILNVSGAFHSRHMRSSQEKFRDFLDGFDFSDPRIPVISNVHAAPYGTNRVKENLAAQITSPVRWSESVEYLIDRGVEDFEEIGPGKVLTGLIRKIKQMRETPSN